MIYTIIILACLAPTDCRSYELPVANLSPIQGYAYIEAQAAVAKWQGMHPNLIVKTFRLEPGRGA
jgi:hypothetical protein